MNLVYPIVCAVVIFLFSGCAKMPVNADSVTERSFEVGREPIAASLFPSDQVVLGDDAVARILSSRLELPSKARVALMKFPERNGDRYYGRYYWRDEVYLKLQQNQIDALTGKLVASGDIAEVTPLPSLMTPARVTLPVLREAAVRMQADLLLVFRVGSDTYSQYRTFSKNQVKAYSTCELVLLDVRTGLVPFTKVVSREHLDVKQPADMDLSETMRRAEQAAASAALESGVADLVSFIRKSPKRVTP